MSSILPGARVVSRVLRRFLMPRDREMQRLSRVVRRLDSRLLGLLAKERRFQIRADKARDVEGFLKMQARLVANGRQIQKTQDEFDRYSLELRLRKEMG